MNNLLEHINGVVVIMSGAVCCYLTWTRVKEGHGTTLDLIMLIASSILMAYGFIMLLPWSAS